MWCEISKKQRPVFYNRHLTEEQIILICKLLVEKKGIRAIERIMDIHRDTISNLIDDLAKYAREVTDYPITNVGLSHIEVDEMWSFFKKKKRKLTKEMLEQINKVTAGYTLESKTKPHLAHSTGKRIQETADEFMKKMEKCGNKPTEDNKATFYSDGNDQYLNALSNCFDTNTKIVDEGETDERLDTAADLLKELIHVTINGFDRLEDKQDTMIEKQDVMIEKMDHNTSILNDFKDETNQHFNQFLNIMTKHDVGAQERITVITEDISDIKKRLFHLESAKV